MVGREGLARATLLRAFADAGAASVVSHLATGNVSFDLAPPELATTIARVEASLAEVVGRPTPVFVRSLAELESMLRSDPFAAAPLQVEHDRTVAFLDGPVPSGLGLPIRSDAGDVVVFAAGERELFTVSARHEGRSRGAGGLIERLLGQPVTSRAWSTVEHVVARQRRPR
jgi:uncharacterized protein (DUF1697 family)